METFTANEAKTRFGEFLDLAQREPVRVSRHERVIGVMVSGILSSGFTERNFSGHARGDTLVLTTGSRKQSVALALRRLRT